MAFSYLMFFLGTLFQLPVLRIAIVFSPLLKELGGSRTNSHQGPPGSRFVAL
jgi:hypothetical protein